MARIISPADSGAVILKRKITVTVTRIRRERTVAPVDLKAWESKPHAGDGPGNTEKMQGPEPHRLIGNESP